MVFAYTINTRTEMNPINKRNTIGGRLEKVTGTFTNAPGDTGGELNLQCDEVISFSPSNLTNANAIKVVLNSSSAGKVTITCTDGDDGTYEATVVQRSK
jgi:hypothetical protein